MGNNGRREAGRKRALGSPASRLQTDKTDNHPDCVSVTDSPPTPISLPDIPINHLGTLPLGTAIPVSHLSLRSWPCGEVCWLLFLPEALALGAPA